MAIALGLMTHMLALSEGLLRQAVDPRLLSPVINLSVSSIACALCTVTVLVIAAQKPETTRQALLPGAILVGLYPLQLLFWMRSAFLGA